MSERLSTALPSAVNSDASADLIERIVGRLAGVLSCSRQVIELAVTTFVAGGHLLLEDVPGVGKTTLAKALSIAVGGSSRRIQFTPDLMPSDVTGVSIYTQASDVFEFHPGPLFANVVIADEINRANPKTQSAMLEAMGEGQISADGETYILPQPFFVVATQNPIELEGTYPLPEAQLDRFMTCTRFGYPRPDDESHMVSSSTGIHPLQGLEQVCTVEEIRDLRRRCTKVGIGEAVAAYIVSIVTQTRNMPECRFGASPRASLHLAAMARARALSQGRDYVIPDDVRILAPAVIAHRLVIEANDYRAATSPRSIEIVEHILDDLPAPTARDGHVHFLSGLSGN